MKTVTLPDGKRVSTLGQSTLRMGEDNHAFAREVARLRLRIEPGTSLIDTAEMYGEKINAFARLIRDDLPNRGCKDSSRAHYLPVDLQTSSISLSICRV
jgi:diketogulonate reductase-like aldo/keto reductase